MKITAKKYSILRIRAKISYHAFMLDHTIFEHFMLQINYSGLDLYGVSDLIKNN